MMKILKNIPEKDIFFPVFDETSQDILGFIHSKEADQLQALGIRQEIS